MKRVLILDTLGQQRRHLTTWLKGTGCDLIPAWSAAKVAAANVEILLTKDHELNAAMLKRWPSVRMVSLAFTGYDEVDRAEARRRGIALYYVPGYATDSVAELALGLTLAALRKIPQGDRDIRARRWDRNTNPGIELRDKTVGIIGTGTIGLRTAELFHAVGCHVVGWARNQNADFVTSGGKYVEWQSLLRTSDVIVLCLALNDQTHHIIGAKAFAAMRPGTVFVNAARAGLVHTPALRQALRSGRIMAGIDVFDDEHGRNPAKSFAGLDNAILTPHLGYKTREAMERLARISIENVGHFLRGDATNRLD